MALTHSNPWRLLDQLQQDLNRQLSLRGTEDDANITTSDWAPAVDIQELEDRYVIQADIPGVDPKDIEVHMENGILAIRGERHSETKEAREGYKRIECSRGTFFRRFSMPDTADANSISAKSKNGVLEITIPKQEKVQKRKIQVEE
jgi:HSP20 family protein